MNPMPKRKPFRSQRLRDLAKEVPHCMACGCQNYGQVVLAHPNKQEFGKGMGLKADDIPCYVCGECHTRIDQQGDEGRWTIGTIRSFDWLLRSGYLEVV